MYICICICSNSIVSEDINVGDSEDNRIENQLEIGKSGNREIGKSGNLEIGKSGLQIIV